MVQTIPTLFYILFHKASMEDLAHTNNCRQYTWARFFFHAYQRAKNLRASNYQNIFNRQNTWLIKDGKKLSTKCSLNHALEHYPNLRDERMEDL